MEQLLQEIYNKMEQPHLPQEMIQVMEQHLLQVTIQRMELLLQEICNKMELLLLLQRMTQKMELYLQETDPPYPLQETGVIQFLQMEINLRMELHLKMDREETEHLHHHL